MSRRHDDLMKQRALTPLEAATGDAVERQRQVDVQRKSLDARGNGSLPTAPADATRVAPPVASESTLVQAAANVAGQLGAAAAIPAIGRAITNTPMSMPDPARRSIHNMQDRQNRRKGGGR